MTWTGDVTWRGRDLEGDVTWTGDGTWRGTGPGGGTSRSTPAHPPPPHTPSDYPFPHARACSRAHAQRLPAQPGRAPRPLGRPRPHRLRRRRRRRRLPRRRWRRRQNPGARAGRRQEMTQRLRARPQGRLNCKHFFRLLVQYIDSWRRQKMTQRRRLRTGRTPGGDAGRRTGTLPGDDAEGEHPQHIPRKCWGCVESVARDAAWRRRRGLRRSWRLRGDDAEGTAARGWKAVRRNSPSVYSRQKPTVHILSSIGMRVGRVAGSLGRGAPDPRNPCGVAGRLKT